MHQKLPDEDQCLKMIRMLKVRSKVSVYLKLIGYHEFESMQRQMTGKQIGSRGLP